MQLSNWEVNTLHTWVSLHTAVYLMPLYCSASTGLPQISLSSLSKSYIPILTLELTCLGQYFFNFYNLICNRYNTYIWYYVHGYSSKENLTPKHVYIHPKILLICGLCILLLPAFLYLNPLFASILFLSPQHLNSSSELLKIWSYYLLAYNLSAVSQSSRI